MIACPCCGHDLLETGAVRLEDEIACTRCGLVWAVASVQPVRLVRVQEEQRHETD
jgi:uncharacterized protein YbaR (Trm112 family)